LKAAKKMSVGGMIAGLREQGTHQELLALRDIYWRLYQLQYKDQEVRASAEM